MSAGIPVERNTQALDLLRRIDEARHTQAGAEDIQRCGITCSRCCKRPFDVSETDLQLLLEGVATSTDLQRRALLERVALRAAHDREALGIQGDAIHLEAIGEDAFDDYCDDDDDHPCPILDPLTQTCALPDYRPEPCRFRGARWRDGEHELDLACPAGEGPSVTVVFAWIDVSARLARLSELSRDQRTQGRTTIALGLDALLRSRRAAG